MTVFSSLKQNKFTVLKQLWFHLSYFRKVDISCVGHYIVIIIMIIIIIIIVITIIIIIISQISLYV